MTAHAQQLGGIQLFNPQTNDETPVIGFNERLVLSFDDFSNTSKPYRYTIKHLNRNWEEDGLFFTEYAEGSMNAQIEDYKFSFNTQQRYTHYTLAFPNDKIRPKISGNYELVVYQNSAERPTFKKRFSVSENNADVLLNISRTSDARNPKINQRVEVQAAGRNSDFSSAANSVTLTVVQNNNPHVQIGSLRPSGNMNNRLVFQQPGIAFAGNNEFYYFDNKIISQPFDMVAGTETLDGFHHTYLHPVWAFPLNYQYQPDVNGAYYFRRNDLGIERNADTEADYSWVYFALDSEMTDREIYVLGGFNSFQPSRENQMMYDEASKKYIAKIYLKQGFYNYILATKSTDGSLDFGAINGNFWQTENLYQAYLYYTPFGKNYDGLIGYGEYRTPVK